MSISQHIHAIYEDGVLKPLEPLHLAEHQRVWVSVAPEASEGMDVADIVARRRQAMEELDAIMDALPDNSPDDGFTSADHDQVLYGKPE
jgi:predicted DNA-binding antitoxin AbrB/MazE fold protein